MNYSENLKWPDLYVAGCDYYRDACKLLIDTAKKNGLLSIDIELEHHPKNPHDSNAVAVYAYIKSGLLFNIIRRRQIGHIPAYTAKDMAYFRGKGGSFSAALAKARYSSGEYPFDIKLDIYSDYKPTKQVRAKGKTKTNFSKVICFAEGLPISNQTAMRLAKDKGYDVRTKISEDVDYLIVGLSAENTNEYKIAKELQAQGHSILIELADKIFTIDEMADASST
ncbi:HIRAN domain-containing protein [Hellea sp.]|nr:HIRAN domain-containing protein [Hellea sp.]